MADGHGTGAIMRCADISKPTVRRWQGRYLDEDVAGLKRDKPRPSRVPPLPRETRLEVVAKTVWENREVERRAGVIGVFPNDEAIIRLIADVRD
jgi:transposase